MAKKAKWEKSPWGGASGSRMSVGPLTLATSWEKGWIFSLRPLEFDPKNSRAFQNEEDAKQAAVTYAKRLLNEMLGQLA